MRRVLVSVLFLWGALFSYGQTTKIDSLRHILYSATGDKERLKAMLALLAEDGSLSRDTLWDYALRAKNLATTLHDQRSLSLAVLAEATAYLRWDNVDSARALIEPELPHYKVTDDADRGLYFKLARARIDCLDYSDNFREATAQAYSLMREANTYKDSVVTAECMNSLAAWNYDMDFVSESKQWSYKAFSATSPTPRFYPALAGICFNLGETYWWMKQYDSAEYFIRRGLDYARRLDDLFFQSHGFSKLASIEMGKKNYKAAGQYIRESIRLIQKRDGDRPNLALLIVQGNIYYHAGQTDKAITVLTDGLYRDSLAIRTSLHQKAGNDEYAMQRMFVYDLLSRCYRNKKDYQHYAGVLEKIIASKDTIYKINSASALAELQTKYEVQKKEATISRQQLALVQDRYVLYGSLVIAVLAGIIVWLVFRNIRRRQQQHVRQLQEDEKRLSAQAVAAAEETERRRIAADLHDNLGAQLSFIKRNVNFILDQPEGFSAEDERKYLGYVNDTAQTAMIDLRETIWVLNRDEVEVQEFVDKLKSYLRQQLKGKETIRWNFTEVLPASWRLPSGEVMHLFRIMQELVNNVIKHSHARELHVSFEGYGPTVYRLIVTDNGSGFDTSRQFEGHYGIENIHRRAAAIGAVILLDSRSQGTRVVLQRGMSEENNTFALLDGEVRVTNIAD